MTKNNNSPDRDFLEFASLSQYSFRERLIIRLTDYFLYAAILVIGKSLRYEPISGWEKLDIPGFETFETACGSDRPPAIIFWHDNIFLQTYYWRHSHSAVMISKSFDGEYIARTSQRFGINVVRGSTTRGGASAMKQLIRLPDKGLRTAITIDGPKGPRHKAKKGALILAKKAGIALVPSLIASKRSWFLNSWDQSEIPKPFSRAKLFVHEPVFVPQDASRELIEEKRQELEQKLDELVKRGEKWRIANN